MVGDMDLARAMALITLLTLHLLMRVLTSTACLASPGTNEGITVEGVALGMSYQDVRVRLGELHLFSCHVPGLYYAEKRAVLVAFSRPGLPRERRVVAIIGRDACVYGNRLRGGMGWRDVRRLVGKPVRVITGDQQDRWTRKEVYQFIGPGMTLEILFGSQGQLLSCGLSSDRAPGHL